MARRKRRKFSDEFKARTVQLVRESDKSIEKIAEEMDLTESALRSWVKADSKETSGLKQVEKEELAELRRENRRLRMERDILKKATAFFARESR